MKTRIERLHKGGNGLLLPAVVTDSTSNPITVTIHGSDTAANATVAVPIQNIANGTDVWVTRAGGKLVVMGLRENTEVPSSIGGTAISVSNFDDVKTTGLYVGTAANGPDTSTWLVEALESTTSAVVFQIAHRHTGNVLDIGLSYERVFASGVWSAWVQISRGSNYSEIRDIIGLTAATGATTHIAGTLYRVDSDYGASQFSGTTWTCPDNGYYDFTMAVRWSSFAANTRTAILWLYGGTVPMYPTLIGQLDIGSNPTGDITMALTAVWLNKNDTVIPCIYQASGATRTISGGFISISQRGSVT
jgi:hypothetical protein